MRELVTMMTALCPRSLPVEETLALAQLDSIAEQRTEKLSGGQAQRVRFALACGQPDLLVLDEPTVRLDVEARQAFWTAGAASRAEARPFCSRLTTSRKRTATQIARC